LTKQVGTWGLGRVQGAGGPQAVHTAMRGDGLPGQCQVLRSPFILPTVIAFAAGESFIGRV